MKVRSLRTRFLLAGCLLLAATVACGAWSVLTFARLGAAIDRTLGENQEAVNLAVELIFALEHEDDALLRALNGDVRRAEDELRAERERFAEAYTRLEPHLNTAAEKEVYVALRAHADAYRKAGDALVAAAGQPAAFEVYSKQANPTLREAVAACRFFRKLNVEAMGRAGSEARDEARRSSLVVAGIALAALLLSAGVVTLLSRSVLRPVGELDRAVEAVRRDDLERRVPVRSADELGRLADGFNRMAATLAEYRRETEERFHQMAENIHEIFWMTDAGQERMLYVSPAYEDVWGRTCQSLYDGQRSWLDGIHPDDRDGVIENMEQRGRGVFTNVEYRIVRPDGSIRWVRSRAFPINDQHGDLSRIAGLAEDITERKRVEEVLRASEERFRFLVQNSWDIISIFDAEGTVHYQAPSVERLLGQRPEDRIGRNVFRDPIVHPDDLGRKRAFFDTILSLPGRPVTAEFRLRHADGSWRDIEAIGQNFLHDPSVAGIVANYRDVTERKRSDEETRKAKERLDLAVRGSNLTIWELEMPDGLLENGRATLINAWEPLGHNPIGAPTDFAAVFALTVHPEDQARVGRAVQACLDGETREYEAEYRVPHKDGSNRWHLARGTVLRDPNGRPIRFIGSTVDITDLKRAEVALRESEERFRTLARATNDAVWDWDLNTNKVWWNEGVLTLFGYRLEANEADPSWWLERVHPDDRASVEAFFFEVVRGKELSWVDEYRFRCADGSYKDVYDRGYVLRDTEGRAVRMIGAVLDITARKRAEEAVRESEHHWRSLAEALPQLVWTCTPDGSCDYLSTQWEKYTGIPAGEQLGWRWSEVLHPDDRERALRCWADAVGGRGNYDLEFRIRRADGEYRWFKTRGVPIRDGAGDVFKWFGTCTDITADKQLEEELRQANARLDLAVRGSNVAIWEIDMPDGVYRNGRGHYLNLWEQLGYDPPEGPVDYATWTGLSHPEDRGRVERAIQACLDGETKEYEAEYRVRHRNGSDRWVLSRGIAVRGPAGKPIRFVGSRTDITDRKRAEKELRQAKEAAEAANRAKDEFLANVSHEIRTPMNAILGMTELALDTPLTEDQRQYLTTVKSAADNLLGLINDLLDFSKIEAGKLELDPADFGLRAALGDTLRALAMRAHRKGLELVCQVQPDVPDALVGDAGRLRQVLLNLIGNAIKFTEEGEVVVRVEVAGDSAPPSPLPLSPSEGERGRGKGEVRLHFAVRDTGIGIPPDKQETIFRAFEQEDTSTTRKYGGTGLGLTIAARLVALMGGQITVDSTPGRGSTFAFTARLGRQPHPPLLWHGLQTMP